MIFFSPVWSGFYIRFVPWDLSVACKELSELAPATFSTSSPPLSTFHCNPSNSVVPTCPIMSAFTPPRLYLCQSLVLGHPFPDFAIHSPRFSSGIVSASPDLSFPPGRARCRLSMLAILLGISTITPTRLPGSD